MIDKVKADFIARLGKMLHMYSTSANKIEVVLSNVTKALGGSGNFFSTPTSLIGSVIFHDHSYPILVRCPPGGISLEKLCQVNDVADSVVDGKISLVDGRDRLKQIETSKDIYPWWITIFAFGLSSASVSVMLGGGVAEFILSMIVGLFVGILGKYLWDRDKMQPMSDTILAFLVTIIAGIFSYKNSNISMEIITLSGIVYLVPGWSITMATTELATNNLVSGSARIVGAIMTAFKLFVGISVASVIITYFDLHLKLPVLPKFPSYFEIVATIFSAIAFTILFKAKFKDLVWLILTALFVYGSYKFTFLKIKPELATFVGAFVISLWSNIFGRIFKRPLSLVRFPGIIFLVPGIMSYRSINLLSNQDLESGMATAIGVAIVSFSIIAGLFFGNLVIDPHRNL